MYVCHSFNTKQEKLHAGLNKKNEKMPISYKLIHMNVLIFMQM